MDNATLLERLVELEGRVTALEAAQRASNTIQEHLVGQLTEIRERVDDLRAMFSEHLKEEQSHWEDVHRYREQRDEAERAQRRTDYYAAIGAVATIIGAIVGGIFTLHMGH